MEIETIGELFDVADIIRSTDLPDNRTARVPINSGLKKKPVHRVGQGSVQ